MASILDDQDQSLLGPDATSGGASTTPSTTTSSGSTTSGAAGTPVTGAAPTGINTQPSSQADVSNIGAANQGVDFSPLITGLQGEGTTARNDLSGAQDTFNTGLGAKPVFGIDQQNTLNDVLKGTQPLTTGSGLLNTTYAGPAGLDSSKFNTSYGKYNTDVGMTQSPDQLTNLLGMRDATLTPGDARFDALAFDANPDFKTATTGLVNDAGNLGKSGTDASQGALDSITQRKSDIGAFNTAGQGYVGAQRDNINNLIGGQMAASTASDNSLNAMLAALKANNGDLSGLADNQLNFARGTYNPAQEVASQYGRSVFDQTINPNDYLSYVAGGDVNRNDSATQDQATQYNNAEALLNLTDRLAPYTRQAAQLGYNPNAFAAALSQAQSGMSAADTAFIARLTAIPTQAGRTAAIQAYYGPGGPGANDPGNSNATGDKDQGTDNSVGPGAPASGTSRGAVSNATAMDIGHALTAAGLLGAPTGLLGLGITKSAESLNNSSPVGSPGGVDSEGAPGSTDGAGVGSGAVGAGNSQGGTQGGPGGVGSSPGGGGGTDNGGNDAGNGGPNGGGAGGGDAGGTGGYAMGGAIRGKGGPRQDNIMTPTSQGEYVINNPASKAIGKPLLDALNRIGNKNESPMQMQADEAKTITSAPGKFMGGQVTAPRAMGVPSKGMGVRGAPSTKLGFAEGGEIGDPNAGGNNLFATPSAAPDAPLAKMSAFNAMPVGASPMGVLSPAPVKTPELTVASLKALQAALQQAQAGHR